MAICTYFQQGRCKFGDQCRYEHPGRQQPAFGSTGNRFGALQPGRTGGAFGGSNQPARKENPVDKYALRAADIKDDLTPGKGRPQWIFSAYGPGKNAPVQLFGGPEREQSFEEMRALHYAATEAGNPQQAIQDANNLYNATETQIQTILNNLDAAIKFVVDGENQHPNRIDRTNEKSVTALSQTTPPFGQSSSFSQPQAPAAAQAAPFGAPSGPSQPQTALGGSVFGRPSSFGQPQQPQQPQQAQQPAFGGTPAFGQPSALGASPFAQPTMQNQPKPNPFGQPTPSPFAQQPSAQQPSPFGQPRPQPQPQTQQASPFGALQGAPAAPFGSTTTAQPPAPSPFGQPSSFGSTQPISKPTPSSIPQIPSQITTKKGSTNLNPVPNINGETRSDPATKLLTIWKGRPVQYIDNHPCYQHPEDPGTYVYIHFPTGPPGPENFKYSVGSAEEYTPAIEEAYKYAKQHGSFKDGLPAVPPKPEWCAFDI